MDRDDFKTIMGSRDGLQGVEREDPALRNERKLKPQDESRFSGEAQVDGRSRHERTVVTTTKETAVFDCGHVVFHSGHVVFTPAPAGKRLRTNNHTASLAGLMRLRSVNGLKECFKL